VEEAMSDEQPPDLGVLLRKGLVGESLEWQKHANCLGVDPELFFPERGESTAMAKEICAGCTVQDDCLEWALEAGEKFGIWGGKSERERRRMRRARNGGREARRRRQVVELFASGRRPVEIASALQIPATNVYNYLRRARELGELVDDEAAS
jgi:WhiB family transcriptional regulator, redox-sensing transcriptional regulator